MNASELAIFRRLLRIHRSSKTIQFGTQEETELLQQIFAIADEVGLHHEFDEANLNIRLKLRNSYIVVDSFVTNKIIQVRSEEFTD